MNRLRTIPRFSIDYQIGDFLAAMRKIFSTSTPSTAEWPWHTGRAAVWAGSGRQALQLILRALHLQPGAKVAVPLYCDFSVARAIDSVSCEPVYIDVEETTLTMCPASLAGSCRDLAAIVVPHFFGHAANITQILEIAGPIPVIEDLAHAPLTMLEDRPVGTFGAASMFSFGSTKPFPAGGGGLAIANDPTLADALLAEGNKLLSRGFNDRFLNLMTHAAKAVVLSRPVYGLIGRAIRPHAAAYQILEPVIDQFQIHPHQAQIALRQAARMESLIEVQRRNGLRLLSTLSDLDGVVVPRERPGARHNFHLLPVLLSSPEEKNFVGNQLLKRHVDTSQLYSDIVTEARGLGYRGGCPVSESVASRLMTLPNNASLRDRDVDYIADVFMASVRTYRLQHSIFKQAQVTKTTNPVRSKSVAPVVGIQ